MLASPAHPLWSTPGVRKLHLSYSGSDGNGDAAAPTSSPDKRPAKSTATGANKSRRSRGSGTTYKRGAVWWIAYEAPDGSRCSESSGSHRKADADLLLQKRVGARENCLPVIPRVERLTFDVAAQNVIDDFATNGKRSLREVTLRIRKHLLPFFTGRRMAGIKASDVTTYIAHRKVEGVMSTCRAPRSSDAFRTFIPTRVRDVSNAQLNRELQVLKRIFALAIQNGQLGLRPHIPMLRENNVRTGFFEPVPAEGWAVE